MEYLFGASDFLKLLFIYIILAALGLSAALQLSLVTGRFSSLAAAGGGSYLVAVHRFLRAAASLVAEHGL